MILFGKRQTRSTRVITRAVCTIIQIEVRMALVLSTKAHLLKTQDVQFCKHCT